MVPFDPMDPWMGTVIGSELDSTVEQIKWSPSTAIKRGRLG
jgi:hypothetical protein